MTDGLGMDDPERHRLLRAHHVADADLAASAIATIFATDTPSDHLAGRPAWTVSVAELAARLEASREETIDQVSWLSRLACDGQPILDYLLLIGRDGTRVVMRPGDGMNPARWIDVVLRAVPSLPFSWGDHGTGKWVAHRYAPALGWHTGPWVDLELTARTGRGGRCRDAAAVRRWIEAALTRLDGKPVLYLRRLDWNEVDAETDEEVAVRHVYQSAPCCSRSTGVARDVAQCAERPDPALVDVYEQYLTSVIDPTQIEW